MPNAMTPLFDPDQLANGFWFDWLEHPQMGALHAPLGLTRPLQSYRFEEATITVDVDGPPVSISQCSVNDFNLSFASGDGVLLGDNVAARMPVHLVFDRPMLALGTKVSANGPVGRDYLAQLSVRFEDGEWQPVMTVGRLSRTRDSAPFLGVRAKNGSRIVEAWFDVFDAKNRIEFSQVAINHFHFLPA